jgi:hypothetical protein
LWRKCEIACRWMEASHQRKRRGLCAHVTCASAVWAAIQAKNYARDAGPGCWALTPAASAGPPARPLHPRGPDLRSTHPLKSYPAQLPAHRCAALWAFALRPAHPPPLQPCRLPSPPPPRYLGCPAAPHHATSCHPAAPVWRTLASAQAPTDPGKLGNCRRFTSRPTPPRQVDLHARARQAGRGQGDPFPLGGSQRWPTCCFGCLCYWSFCSSLLGSQVTAAAMAITVASLAPFLVTFIYHVLAVAVAAQLASGKTPSKPSRLNPPTHPPTRPPCAGGLVRTHT